MVFCSLEEGDMSKSIDIIAISWRAVWNDFQNLITVLDLSSLSLINAVYKDF